jgi:hypothetical protein
MAPTEPAVMIAAKDPPQRQHAKSQSNNIFDVRRTENDDDEPGPNDIESTKCDNDS